MTNIRPYIPSIGDCQILDPLGQAVVVKTTLEGAERLREGQQTVNLFTHTGWAKIIDENGERTRNSGALIRFAKPWNTDGRTWIESACPGPWAIDNSNGAHWGIVNTETGATVKVGPVAMPRSRSRVNYFDRASDEAIARNIKASFPVGTKVLFGRGPITLVGVVSLCRRDEVVVTGGELGVDAALSDVPISDFLNLTRISEAEFDRHIADEPAFARMAAARRPAINRPVRSPILAAVKVASPSM